jgi:hypothetical protein
LADTGNAGRQPRIVEANDYFQTLLTQGFCVKARFWEGVGHDIAPGVAPLSEECFVLATTGLYPGQSELVQAEIARVEAVVDSGDLDAAKKAVAALPKFRLPALARKSPARSKQPAVEQTAQRAAWVQAGLGGTCTLGQGGEMWIDDSNENTFGWNEGRAAEEARRAALLSMLRDRAKELKQRLAVLEKAAKAKPPEGR